MKKISILLISLLSALSMSADNGLSISGFGAVPGETKTVSVELNNTSTVTGFQFDMVLPAGVSLTDAELTGRRTSYKYSLSQKVQRDGSVRFVCMPSSDAAVFTGNSGEVMTLTLAVAANAAVGDCNIELKNQYLTIVAGGSFDELNATQTSATVHIHGLEKISMECLAFEGVSFWHCSACDKYFNDANAASLATVEKSVIEAKGHVHSATPSWDWAENGKSATALFICNKNDDTIRETASITSVTKAEATCTVGGTTAYTAKVTYKGTEFSSTKDVQDIAAMGHDIQYTDNGDGTHSKYCTHCDVKSEELHTYKNDVCELCGSHMPEKGDVNNDGIVNKADALLVTDYYIGKKEKIHRYAADMNDDDVIDMTDVVLIIDKSIITPRNR